MGERKKESEGRARGPQCESNPGLLQRGHSPVHWVPHSLTHSLTIPYSVSFTVNYKGND